MGLFSDLITNALGGFPSKPGVPQFTPLDLQTEQGKALTANLQNLGNAETLTGQANTFNQQQIEQMLTNIIPNYKSITSTASSNINSELAGNIPKDVQDAIANSGAAKALGGGFGGSGMGKDLVARDLGLTSLGIINQGLSSAESWLGETAATFRPGMTNVASMFVTPAQQATLDTQQQAEQWNVQWLQNQLNAMPDPSTAAIARDVGGIGDLFGSALGGAVGGMGGVGEGVAGGLITAGAGGGGAGLNTSLNAWANNEGGGGGGGL